MIYMGNFLNRSLKADFVTRVKLVRERMKSKESEVEGEWLTEEAMKKSNRYSAQSIKHIKNYCQKFPETLCRPEVCPIHTQNKALYTYINKTIHSCIYRNDSFMHSFQMHDLSSPCVTQILEVQRQDPRVLCGCF